MENEYFNQRIACSVTNCKYYDEEEKRCTLGSILVNFKKEKAICENYQKNEL